MRLTALCRSAERPVLLGAAAVLAVLGVVGCGCSADRKGERIEPAAAARPAPGFEMWGASFSLPDGWSGGENDAGGYELTDGELALMVGRHELDPEQTLESFIAERRRALEQMGGLTNEQTSQQRVGATSTVQLRARAAADAGGVSLRLLVARLGPREGISLLMLGDAGDGSRMDPAWATLLSSLRLP